VEGLATLKMEVADTSETLLRIYHITRLDIPLYHGKIILRGIIRKWEEVVGTGWSGFRIGTGGGHL
jgi:hypothetical protein